MIVLFVALSPFLLVGVGLVALWARSRARWAAQVRLMADDDPRSIREEVDLAQPRVHLSEMGLLFIGSSVCAVAALGFLILWRPDDGEA